MGWYESCLKPVIEVATFMGVVAALFYQESIIKSQRKEFERQRIKDNKQEFNDLFFNLHSMYNETKVNIHKYYGENHENMYHDYLETIVDKEFLNNYDSLFDSLEQTIQRTTPKRYIDWVHNGRLPFSIDSNMNLLIIIINQLDDFDIFDSKEQDKKYKEAFFKMLFDPKDKFELLALCIWGLDPKFETFKTFMIQNKFLDNLLGTSQFNCLLDLYKEEPLT
ncbi:hypothetical protein [Myroides fluvii]|uniref:hypothetical protein n=1 Tax=Myroides fluvii TaxID=2572594 RepID=UPI00131E7DA4|nr:hypothetical protein [Myroides fluvii]